MGKKEKLRKLSSIAAPPQKQDNIINIARSLDSKILSTRAEVFEQTTFIKENMVRIVSEMKRIKDGLDALYFILMKNQVIDKDQLDAAKEEIAKIAGEFFKENGKMHGKPEVTMYNCDFDLNIDNSIAEKKVTKTLEIGTDGSC